MPSWFEGVGVPSDRRAPVQPNDTYRNPRGRSSRGRPVAPSGGGKSGTNARSARADSLEQQLEAELYEAREVRLGGRVLVDGAELVAVLVGDVLPLVVHRGVEHVEGLDPDLQPDPVGDPRGLGQVHGQVAIGRPSQSSVP